MFKLKIIVCIDLFDILINQQTLMPSKFNKRDIKNLLDFVHPLIEYLAIYQNLKLKVSRGGRRRTPIIPSSNKESIGHFRRIISKLEISLPRFDFSPMKILITIPPPLPSIPSSSFVARSYPMYIIFHTAHMNLCKFVHY